MSKDKPIQALNYAEYRELTIEHGKKNVLPPNYGFSGMPQKHKIKIKLSPSKGKARGSYKTKRNPYPHQPQGYAARNNVCEWCGVGTGSSATKCKSCIKAKFEAEQEENRINARIKKPEPCRALMIIPQPMATIAKIDWEIDKELGGFEIVKILCPECGEKINLLARSYTIDNHGRVSPKVICTSETCPFAEYVILEQWATGFKAGFSEVL